MRTAHSVAGGADRAGKSAFNAALTAVHRSPSTLLWLKLGGIDHVLAGDFIALAAIIRALALMPHRLGYEIERTQG